MAEETHGDELAVLGSVVGVACEMWTLVGNGSETGDRAVETVATALESICAFVRARGAPLLVSGVPAAGQLIAALCRR